MSVSVCLRLRILRQEKQLSQGDIEKRTGLLRCYVSRVENGHTVPSIGTLEKWARALRVPLYQLFYAPGDSPVTEETSTGRPSKEQRFLSKIREMMSRMEEADQHVLLSLAQKMAKQKPAIDIPGRQP